MTALKYEQALRLNATDLRRRTGVDPETFAEMEAVLHDREASNCAPAGIAGGRAIAVDTGILAGVPDVLPPGAGVGDA